MAEKAKCIITKSYEGKGAYGIRTDNDENVYFPLGVSESLEIEEYDELEAVLIRNGRPNLPWKAIRARRIGEDIEDDI